MTKLVFTLKANFEAKQGAKLVVPGLGVGQVDRQSSSKLGDFVM